MSTSVSGPKTSSAQAQPCDVLVIGGGPAGSTIGSFLAEKGWKVVIIEKDVHPRFHIGESLLPLNMPLLDRLGVRDQVHEIGLVKLAAEFNYEGYRPATYYFAEAMGKDNPSAYQVRRSEFDHILLRNSATKGAEVHEGTRVVQVEFREGQTSLVTSEDDKGAQRRWEARFVVDASGRDTFLANRFGIKHRNPQHNSSAIFGHFEGVERRPGKDEGNISIYWFEHGWYWMIPLNDGAMSVGAVCWPYYLKSRKTGVDQFLLDTLALNPEIRARMKNARLMAPASATGNFSYAAERVGGDGYLMVGDSFAFVDPVFSSGVFLAMSSAERGAQLVDETLRAGRMSARSLRAYEKAVRGGIRTFSWFIYRITSPAMRKMFMSPRNTFRIQEAVLSLLAADIFRGTPIRFPLFMFKVIYYLSSALHWRDAFASWRQRKLAWKSLLDFTWKTGT